MNPWIHSSSKFPSAIRTSNSYYTHLRVGSVHICCFFQNSNITNGAGLLEGPLLLKCRFNVIVLGSQHWLLNARFAALILGRTWRKEKADAPEMLFRAFPSELMGISRCLALCWTAWPFRTNRWAFQVAFVHPFLRISACFRVIRPSNMSQRIQTHTRKLSALELKSRSNWHIRCLGREQTKMRPLYAPWIYQKLSHHITCMSTERGCVASACVEHVGDSSSWTKYAKLHASAIVNIWCPSVFLCLSARTQPQESCH